MRHLTFDTLICSSSVTGVKSWSISGSEGSLSAMHCLVTILCMSSMVRLVPECTFCTKTVDSTALTSSDLMNQVIPALHISSNTGNRYSHCGFVKGC
jgi:hypothetical protein